MKYPTIRYGNPAEMHFYAQGMSIKSLSKILKRSEKSITSWLNGNRKVPWWVPELLRLRLMEREHVLYQMNMQPLRRKLGLVQKTGEVILMPNVQRNASEMSVAQVAFQEELSNHHMNMARQKKP